MGEHDGIWFLEKISDLPLVRDIPVLVLSQRGDAVREARAFGNVVGAVEKPARDEDRAPSGRRSPASCREYGRRRLTCQ